MDRDVPVVKRALRGRLCGLALLVCGLLLIPGVSPSGAPGGTDSRPDAPALVADGGGGAFVAWRDAGGIVTVQRVDVAGARRWPAPGVRLGASSSAPRLAVDGAGGLLVGRLDTDGRVQAQRLSGDGTALWSSAGAQAGVGPSFGIVADGLGGAYLAWEETSPACCGIVVQHLDSAGVATWSDGGRRLAAAGVAVGESLAMAGDDAGGIRAAFTTVGGPIELHRLGPDGVERGAVVTVASATTPGALVMAEGLAGGVVLAWTERDGAGVRAQHVDAAAGTAWADGAPATDGALAAADVQIAVDALGRTAVAWQDARDASDGCPQDCVTRVQRLGADGAREWSDGGRPLGTLPAFGARIVAVGDGVVAAWQHCPTPTCAGASDVHVQALGGSASLTVGEAPLDSRVALVADGAGGVIVAWWQCAAGACEVRTRRLALDALQALAPAAPAADLVLTALTAAAQAAPGQTLQVSSTVRNAGGTAAASFRVGFYLSSSNSSAIGGSLIGFRTIDVLPAAMSKAISTAVTIPNNASAGSTFLVAFVDDRDEVVEDNEDNNLRSVRLTIVKPDLVVSAVTAPATGTIGGTLAVNTTIRNLTTGQVSTGFTVGIFLSTDATVDPAVDLRIGSRTIDRLAGSGTSSASTTVNIPPDLVPGSYFVGALADVDHVVPEGNTSNNTRVAAARTAFAVALTSFTPAMGPVGTPVTITGASLPAVKEVRFFDGVNVSTFSLLPPATLRTTVPSGATTGRITFVFVGGNVSSTTVFRVTPAIAAFAPPVALVDDSVTVTGTTLAGATVKIGPTPAAVLSSSDTELVFTVPRTARSGRISVTNAGGTATARTDLIVVRPPTISNFTPTAGPEGAKVTINGDQFAAATDVSFNGVSAGPPTILSPTSIRSVVPGGATTGPIGVTNPAGNTSSTAVFHVAPRVTGFSPPRGLPGANVSITGTTLTGTIAVRFGSVPAVVFTPISAGEVVATVPVTAMTGRITVVTPDGQSVSPADFLVIRPPTLTSLSPGAAAVGAFVTLGGTNLASATAVTFNGAPVDRRTVLSNSALRVTVPFGATTGRVSVTNAAGSANSSAVFRVLPAITSVSPSSGFIGDTVTITGTTLTDPQEVRIGSVSATVVTSSDTQVVITVPSDATTNLITVRTGAGTASSPSVFEVIRPPTINAFTPAAAPTGTDVTIDGQAVGSATEVTFNGVNASFTRVLSSRIRARVPLLATSGSIGITNPASSVLSASPFRVTPRITDFTPVTGPLGTAVTINGSGFGSAPTVRFGDSMPTAPTSVSLTALVVLVPDGATTGFVTVTTRDGLGNSSTRFTVIRTPTLTSFTPLGGPAGTSVLLGGTSLTDTSIVKFNGVPAETSRPNASVTTSLRAAVPMGATTGRITITNEAGTVTSGGNFRVLPTVTDFTPTAGEAGTTVTINGNALNEATAVRFGSAAGTVLSGNASQVLAIVPGTATTGPITVTTIEGSATSAADFEVLAPLTASSTSPLR